MAWLGGLRVVVHGPRPPAGALLAPNHLGYLDIVACAAALECTFVSKSEPFSWPLVGHLLRAAEVVPVDRRSARSLPAAVAALAEQLDDGLRVCAFLEGTSSGGDRVLRFHSSLLAAAIRVGAPVVPVAISYHPHQDGVFVAEDLAYWRAQHQFARHLFRLLGLCDGLVVVRVGAPIDSAGWQRQALAEELHRQVVQLAAIPEPPGVAIVTDTMGAHPLHACDPARS